MSLHPAPRSLRKPPPEPTELRGLRARVPVKLRPGACVSVLGDFTSVAKAERGPLEPVPAQPGVMVILMPSLQLCPLTPQPFPVSAASTPLT